ncbi:MAG: hypothetical protein IT233_08555, partial [Bacteroidia bacterium]|nr:hypothetical protein [Bacteroidia bacterium]
YEKLKTLYKDSFKRDLEADLLPPLPTGLPSWVSEIKTVEDYLNRLPPIKRQEVEMAFQAGTIELFTPTVDLELIRHISPDGYLRSYWFSFRQLAPMDAKRLLALPIGNSAEYISKLVVKRGIPVLRGKVASQVGQQDFGPYATGGGEQVFILRELWENDDLVKLLEGPIPNLLK